MVMADMPTLANESMFGLPRIFRRLRQSGSIGNEQKGHPEHQNFANGHHIPGALEDRAHDLDLPLISLRRRLSGLW
jgi:hypothetical protein